MFLMTTCTHTCVCLCTEGERPEENESTTDSNFFFVNQRNKRKLRPLPLFVRNLRITFLVTYTHEVMTDKLNGWGHTRPVQTFPLPPTVRLDTPGDFQETLQIQVEAVKISSAQQLREGPQDFTRAGYDQLRPGWRSTEKEEGQHWCCQVLGLSQYR